MLSLILQLFFCLLGLGRTEFSENSMDLVDLSIFDSSRVPMSLG